MFRAAHDGILSAIRRYIVAKLQRKIEKTKKKGRKTFVLLPKTCSISVFPEPVAHQRLLQFRRLFCFLLCHNDLILSELFIYYGIVHTFCEFFLDENHFPVVYLLAVAPDDEGMEVKHSESNLV